MFNSYTAMKQKPCNNANTKVSSQSQVFLLYLSNHFYDIPNTAPQGPSGWHIKTKLEVKKGEKEFYILSRMGRNRRNLSHLVHSASRGAAGDRPFACVN